MVVLCWGIIYSPSIVAGRTLAFPERQILPWLSETRSTCPPFVIPPYSSRTALANRRHRRQSGRPLLNQYSTLLHGQYLRFLKTRSLPPFVLTTRYVGDLGASGRVGKPREPVTIAAPDIQWLPDTEFAIRIEGREKGAKFYSNGAGQFLKKLARQTLSECTSSVSPSRTNTGFPAATPFFNGSRYSPIFRGNEHRRSQDSARRRSNREATRRRSWMRSFNSLHGRFVYQVRL